MNADMTKNEIAAEINEIRATLNRPPLAAWKVKDLTKDQLVEIYDGLLFEIEQDGEDAVDDDPSAQALVDDVLAGNLSFTEAVTGLIDGTIKLDDEVVIDNATGELLEKTCKRCGETKPLTEFLKDSKKADGHFHMCGSRKRGCVQAYYADLKDRKDAEALEENRRNDNNG